MRKALTESLLKTYRILMQFGMDPFRSVRAMVAVPAFLSHWVKFRLAFKQQKVKGFSAGFRLFPQLGDREGGAGSVATHYFQMDLYVAQRIFEKKPRKHFDVGSRIDGFVAHVASYRPIEVLDIRPLTDAPIRNISFRQADLMDESVLWESDACDSVSCLHVLEHFGLGRYGDPIDPLAHERGFRNLARLVEPAGTLYFAVPVSNKPRIEFNAHRIFSFPYLRELIGSSFKIQSVAVVNDDGILLTERSWDDSEADLSWGCHYGCVILTLQKRQSATKS